MVSGKRQNHGHVLLRPQKFNRAVCSALPQTTSTSGL